MFLVIASIINNKAQEPQVVQDQIHQIQIQVAKKDESKIGKILG